MANGCTDQTAQAARHHPGVTVIETETPSKNLALQAGDAAATHPTRAWVDADVVLSRSDLLRCVRALGAGVQIASPRRNMDLSGASLLVRLYYSTWERLPAVRDGVFGRGVLVMSPEGHQRVTGLPRGMADDLIASDEFAQHERVVVEAAAVHVVAPKRTSDLLRRRVRVATGVKQADQLGLRQSSSTTRASTLLSMLLQRPSSAPSLAVFVAVALVAKVQARQRVRRGDFSTWLRDDSSRG